MGNFGGDRRGGGGRNFGRRDFGGGRDRGFGGERHEMFSAVCSQCGKDCQVPFRPTNGKPVYCSECFGKVNGGRDSRRPERENFRPQVQNSDQNKGQFEAINAKLDKILSILTPTPTPVVKVAKTDVAQVAAEIKPEKVEKAAKVAKKPASKKKK